MALQAKAGGTAERPRIDSFTLKIPLFGSSDYNAVVDGNIQFTERRLWEDAAIQGKLVVEPLALMRLRPLKFFEQNLPAANASARAARRPACLGSRRLPTGGAR